MYPSQSRSKKMRKASNGAYNTSRCYRNFSGVTPITPAGVIGVIGVMFTVHGALGI